MENKFIFNYYDYEKQFVKIVAEELGKDMDKFFANEEELRIALEKEYLKTKEDVPK